MANFQPLKDRFIGCLARSIRRHGVVAPFMDFGCGRGDVAAHLIKQHQFQGDLFDANTSALNEVMREQVFARSKAYSDLADVPDQHYGLVVAFDVLEHLEEPEKVLSSLSDKLETGGHIAIIVPYRPSTWGWDDDFYGHLRRWSKKELEQVVQEAGLEPIEVLDPTFPFYRLIRQGMLWLRRPPKGVVDPVLEDVGEEYARRSLESPHHDAWGEPPGLVKLVPWRLVNWVSMAFEKIFLGDEIYVLCRKNG